MTGWVAAPLAAVLASGAAWLLVGGSVAGSRRLARPAPDSLTGPLTGPVVAWRRWRPGRRVTPSARAAATRQFVAALVTELSAGRPPTGAVAAAAGEPEDREGGFAHLARSASLGGDLPTRLDLMAAAPGAAGLARVAACWRLAERSGSGLHPALQEVLAGMRDDADVAREVAGQLAGPRATARLLAGLPLVAWVMGGALGAEPLRVLVGTPYGLACLLIGSLLIGGGLAWVEAMARGVDPWRQT